MSLTVIDLAGVVTARPPVNWPLLALPAAGEAIFGFLFLGRISFKMAPTLKVTLVGQLKVARWLLMADSMRRLRRPRQSLALFCGEMPK
eukprot:scaffold28845_cov123-Isochrysis_galbana.AAC.3